MILWLLLSHPKRDTGDLLEVPVARMISTGCFSSLSRVSLDLYQPLLWLRTGEEPIAIFPALGQNRECIERSEIQMNRPQRDAPLLKDLPCKQKNYSLISRIHVKSQTW